MRTLVTGATGYLGTELVRELRARGREVRALARSPESARRLDGTGAEIVLGDVTQPESLPAALDGVERVFHLAGVVGHRARDEAALQAVNVDGSAALLAVDPGGGRRPRRLRVQRRRHGAGGQRDPSPHRGALPDRRRRPPGRLPLRTVEGMGRAARPAGRRRGQDVVVANPGFVIGPGDVHRVSAWPIEEYLRGVLRFTVRGGLSYVDARDAVQGLLLVEERGRPATATSSPAPTATARTPSSSTWSAGSPASDAARSARRSGCWRRRWRWPASCTCRWCRWTRRSCGRARTGGSTTGRRRRRWASRRGRWRRRSATRSPGSAQDGYRRH